MAASIRVPFVILKERTTKETPDALAYIDFHEEYVLPTDSLTVLRRIVNHRLKRSNEPEVVDGLRFFTVRPIVL